MNCSTGSPPPPVTGRTPCGRRRADVPPFLGREPTIGSVTAGLQPNREPLKMASIPKIFELEIRPFVEADAPAVAAVHIASFPEKLESLLGIGAIVDTYRERVFAPGADTYGLVAISRRDGRLAGFVLSSELGVPPALAHRFIGSAALRRHFVRRAPFSPRLWRFVLERIRRKFAPHGENEGATLPLGPTTCVVKLLGVDPAFRFGNTPFDLMLAAEEEARRRGATRVCGLVEASNRAAERVYERLGWVRTSPHRRDFAVFAMHKDLTQRSASETEAAARELPSGRT